MGNPKPEKMGSGKFISSILSDIKEIAEFNGNFSHTSKTGADIAIKHLKCTTTPALGNLGGKHVSVWLENLRS